MRGNSDVSQRMKKRVTLRYNTAASMHLSFSPSNFFVFLLYKECRQELLKCFDDPPSFCYFVLKSKFEQQYKKKCVLIYVFVHSSLPSRHSLEAKEPDLLQVPQVVQIEHMTAPYIEEDCDPSNQGGCQGISIYQANIDVHSFTLVDQR